MTEPIIVPTVGVVLRRSVRVLFRIVGLGILPVFTLIAPAGVWLFLALGVGSWYSPPTTAADWIREISVAAENLVIISSFLAVGVAAAAAMAIVAGFFREIGITVVASVCAACFLVMLAFVATNGQQQVRDLGAIAISAAGSTPAMAPPPPEPEQSPPPLGTAEARAELVRLARLSLEATVGPAVDAEGAVASADEPVIVSSPCGEIGAVLSMELVFSSTDPAASLASILAAWDAEGYAPDAAMQTSIRYSDTLPVASLHASDRSSIDGMLHLRLTSACAIPGQ